MLLPSALLSVLAATPAGAEVLYNAINLTRPPQPAYDLAHARPALTLHRPAQGAMNDLGQLTGAGDAGFSMDARDTRPFFYDPSRNTAGNLGDLNGDFADQAVLPRNDASKGMGLNDLGWVVGYSSTSETPGVADDRPLLWFDTDGNHAHTPGEMHQLALNPGATYGWALRVNNHGRALINGETGLYHTTLSLSTGVPSETSARGFIANPVSGTDINNAGDVTFNANNAGHVWRDLDADNVADPGEITQVPFMSETSANSAAFGINDAGQVVGTMRNAFNQDIAYIWTDADGDNVFDWIDSNDNGFFEADEVSSEVVRFHGDARGINAPDGKTFLFDINNQGQAVGGYFDASERKAFVYDNTGGMRFLNDLVDPSFTLDLRQADAINNMGQIAAIGRDTFASADQLVLLTPVHPVLQGDLDNDGLVGITDLNIILVNWDNQVPAGDASRGDPSGDGLVAIEDLALVLNNWDARAPSDAAMVSIPTPGVLSMIWLGVLMLLKR